MKPALGIDCSGERCSVAVATDAGVFEHAVTQPGEQLRLLFPMVLSLLAEQGVSPAQLGRIAVAVGPGSFTGLRLAIATAKTMAQLLDIPLVAISTLDLVALALREWAPDATDLCVLADARKGQIFAARFSVTPSGLRRDEDYVVLMPDEATTWLAGGVTTGTVAGGSALRVYGEKLRGVLGVGREAPAQTWLASARFAARAAREEYGPVAEIGYADVAPLYLRPPDVKKPPLPPLRELS